MDLEEAYQVGRKAAQIAAEDGSGYMSTILREPGQHLSACATTRCRWSWSPTPSARFPEAWIAPSRTDVTDDFVRYARPLIGDGWPTIPLVDGLQRFARFEPIFADTEAGVLRAAGLSVVRLAGNPSLGDGQLVEAGVRFRAADGAS